MLVPLLLILVGFLLLQLYFVFAGMSIELLGFMLKPNPFTQTNSNSMGINAVLRVTPKPKSSIQNRERNYSSPTKSNGKNLQSVGLQDGTPIWPEQMLKSTGSLLSILLQSYSFCQVRNSITILKTMTFQCCGKNKTNGT